jgi:hypothetical protein
MSNLIIRSGTCGGVKDSVLFQVGMADGSSRQGPGDTRVRWLHRCAYVRIRLSDAVKLGGATPREAVMESSKVCESSYDVISNCELWGLPLTRYRIQCGSYMKVHARVMPT